MIPAKKRVEQYFPPPLRGSLFGLYQTMGNQKTEEI